MQTEIKQSKFEQFLSQRRSYILGVIVGISLIAVNTFVGLYVLRLVLEDDTIPVVPGLSLPVIKIKEYELAEKDYLDRQTKDLKANPDSDPFKTTIR